MAGPNGNYSAGTTLEVDADIGQKLVDQKAAEWIAPKRQKPIEKAVIEPEVEHIGGGWYLVNGTKVKGRKAVEEALKG